MAFSSRDQGDKLYPEESQAVRKDSAFLQIGREARVAG